MTASAAPQTSKRVRTSERALLVALKALQSSGLSVEKLLITGGQIEIHCGTVEEKPQTEKHGGLKQW
jgi:hypothetical protein